MPQYFWTKSISKWNDEVEPPLVYKLPSAVKVSSGFNFTSGKAFVKALQAST
ncbi:hypothetical protein ACQ9BO_06495 [Flavobacterium sp. P21]|uniref:hypothetical protein n=1 Tax=Flavobacterium sp. P21 TaxID=3423948 RepID=UPI003D677CB1